MAAGAQLSVLLFALSTNTHAQQLVIQAERSSYTFSLPEQAGFCQISKSVGGEKLVLWTISDLGPLNVSAPEGLRQRLSVVNLANISFYTIHGLTQSDSGLYQEQCWAEGKATHEENTTFTICGKIDATTHFALNFERREELRCEKAADNLDILWLKHEAGFEENIWEYILGDISVMDNIKGRFHEVGNTSVLHVSNFTSTELVLYVCLVMDQQRCVHGQLVHVMTLPELIYHSVRETAVLPCTLTDFTDDQVPRWRKFNHNPPSYTEMGQNYSLVLSSLELKHSGWYACQSYKSKKGYVLMVCPEFGPPAAEFFSQGDNVTLRCKDGVNGMTPMWFIKSNLTGGKIFSMYAIMFDKSMSRIRAVDMDLVITNMSVEDAGEYWCAFSGPDCVSATKTVMKHRESSGFGSTAYTVRCSLLSSLLLLLCAVVAAVLHRSWRGEQL